MTISADASVPIEHTDRIFIGGEWVTPSSGSTITVIDSHTEQACVTVAEAQPADIDRAVTAAGDAFDHGPWPRLTHAQRAAYLRALGEEVVKRYTIYGLHGALFTPDVERARRVAGQLRTGTIGHNGFKSDYDMGHGGFKQSGIGREGGIEGLLPFLEGKVILLDGPTARSGDVTL
jgi:acyl-CoA reductase-like NAD-dependent aldehyde dehydrogenase